MISRGVVHRVKAQLLRPKGLRSGRSRRLLSGRIVSGPSGPFGGHATLGDVAIFWKMNEESGARADEVGSNDLADNNTVLYTAGVIGNAARFAAAKSEYLSIADNADVSITGDCFFSVWFRTDTTTAHRAIIAKDKAAAPREFLLFHRSTTNLDWIVFNDLGQTSVATEATVSEDVWHHAVCWWDTADFKARMVVDGGTTRVGAGHGRAALDSTAAFRVGALDNAGTPYCHDGDIDLLGKWNRLPTAGEITDLYNGGVGLDY